MKGFGAFGSEEPHLEAQEIGLPIGTGHFDKLVDVAHCGNVLGYERLQLGIQLDGVRFVPPDVLEQVPDLLGYLPRRVQKASGVTRSARQSEIGRHSCFGF